MIHEPAINAIKNAIAMATAQAQGAPKSFEDERDIYTRNGSTADIQVRGVLTSERSWWAYYIEGGNVTYGAIIDALDRAEADPEVKKINLHIKSPGGTVAGMYEAMDRIKAATKPVSVYAYDQVASAAYGLASQADDITLVGKAVAVGSVGVATQMWVHDDLITITSSHAEDKRPDPRTEEGKATIRADLDQYEALFIEAIAEGRGVSVGDVQQNYGRGATYLSAEAVKRGMADAISTTATNRTDAEARTGARATTMNLEKLRAEHPDVYAAAVKTGADNERDRVVAHLELAEGSGDVTAATDAIRAGDGITHAIQARHLKAAMLRRDVEASVSDNDVTAAVDGETQPETKDFNAQVADQLAAMHGLTE